MEKKISYVILLIFFILGLYLRTSGTINNNFAFNFDQGKDLLALDKLVNERHLTLIGPSAGIDGVFHGAYWYYILAPFFWIFSGDPKMILLCFSFFCSLIILVAYWFGKTILNYKFGLLMAGLVSISEYFIRSSVQLWHPFLLPILIFLLLFYLWKFFHNKISFFWIGIILGLIFEFEVLAGGFFIIAFFITFFVIKSKLFIQHILKGFLGLFIILIPRILFEIRHNFIQTKSLVNYFLNYEAKIGNLPIWERLGNRLQSFFDIFSEIFTHNNKTVAFLLLIGCIVFFIFNWTKIKPIEYKKFLSFIFVLLIIMYILTGVYPDVLWSYYYICLPVLFLIIFTSGLYIFIKNTKYLGMVVYICIFIYMLSPWNLFTNTDWVGDSSTYKNEIRVVNEIYKQAGNDEFNIQVYSPAIIDYNYQYLFLWYGKRQFGKIPEKEKIVKTVFFIIEPNPNHPTLPAKWLRERDGDGTIYWQEEFPGGIKVEKRNR